MREIFLFETISHRYKSIHIYLDSLFICISYRIKKKIAVLFKIYLFRFKIHFSISMKFVIP